MGVLFDGASYVRSPAGQVYTRAESAHSVSFWFTVTGLTGHRRAFGTTGRWHVRSLSSGILQDRLLDDGNPRPGVVVTSNEVHHCAIVVEPQNTQFRLLYIDGVLVNTENNPNFRNQQSARMSIGTSGTNVNQWEGSIADVRIYDRLLEAEEIETIHAAEGIDGIDEALQHRWKMDEGDEGEAVTTLYDDVAGLDLTGPVGNPVYDGTIGTIGRRHV